MPFALYVLELCREVLCSATHFMMALFATESLEERANLHDAYHTHLIYPLNPTQTQKATNI